MLAENTKGTGGHGRKEGAGEGLTTHDALSKL